MSLTSSICCDSTCVIIPNAFDFRHDLHARHIFNLDNLTNRSITSNVYVTISNTRSTQKEFENNRPETIFKHLFLSMSTNDPWSRHNVCKHQLPIHATLQKCLCFCSGGYASIIIQCDSKPESIMHVWWPAQTTSTAVSAFLMSLISVLDLPSWDEKLSVSSTTAKLARTIPRAFLFSFFDNCQNTYAPQAWAALNRRWSIGVATLKPIDHLSHNDPQSQKTTMVSIAVPQTSMIATDMKILPICAWNAKARAELSSPEGNNLYKIMATCGHNSAMTSNAPLSTVSNRSLCCTITYQTKHMRNSMTESEWFVGSNEYATATWQMRMAPTWCAALIGLTLTR